MMWLAPTEAEGLLRGEAVLMCGCFRRDTTLIAFSLAKLKADFYRFVSSTIPQFLACGKYNVP